MQKISDDLNKMKCLSFCGIAIRRPRLILLQVINCERKLDSGFPLRIHRLTTTLHVKPITMGPPRGSLKGLSIMNGKRQALLWTHGNRTVIHSFPIPTADGLWF